MWAVLQGCMQHAQLLMHAYRSLPGTGVSVFQAKRQEFFSQNNGFKVDTSDCSGDECGFTAALYQVGGSHRQLPSGTCSSMLRAMVQPRCSLSPPVALRCACRRGCWRGAPAGQGTSRRRLGGWWELRAGGAGDYCGISDLKQLIAAAKDSRNTKVSPDTFGRLERVRWLGGQQL